MQNNSEVSFWDKIVGLFKKKEPTVNSDKKVDEKDNSTTSKDQKGMAVLPIIGTVISAATGIFTSLSQVKNSKLAIEQDKEKLKQLKEQGNLEEQETLQKAIELKIKQQEVLESKEKANANIRGLIYVLLFALIGFIVWVFFGKKRPQNSPSQLGLPKKRNLLNENI